MIQNSDNEEDIEYYKVENGVREEITASESIYLNDSVMSEFSRPEYFIKEVGLRFVSAFAGETSDAPLADFSSYDSILDMYKKIIEVLPDYTYLKWVEGEYDGLYTFADDEAYEIFHSVFYASSRARPTSTYFGDEYAENGNSLYGYAEKDLDGDGTNELILMEDSYNILSVFTQKDEKAVLIYSPGSNKSCFIDSEGLLHVSLWTGGLTGRDSEYFLYELKNGKLECCFAIGSKRNIQLEHSEWYKIEEGKNIPMPEDEWNELYARYDLYPEISGANERTKNFANVDFVRFYEKVEPTVRNYVINHMSDLGVEILSVDGGKVGFKADYFKYDESDLVFETVIEATAILTDGKYLFDSGTVSGELEFCVNGIWLTINESREEEIDCRSYFHERTIED